MGDTADRAYRIDAHQHFWDPSRTSYPWMEGPALDPIRRTYGPVDLRPEIQQHDIDGTVLVQTISSVGETQEFLGLTDQAGFVWGVVGWIDLTDARVGEVLDDLVDGPGGRRLVGIRHQVHDEPDADWLRRDDVRRGLRAVRDRGLTYDLLVRARELPAAIDTVAALPDLQFILDHIAKPRIAAGRDAPWSATLPGLAALPNVMVKLSGMVTEADWSHWTASDLQPFVGAVVDWFGLERVMFGSDWPVCLLASTYPGMYRALEEALGPLSTAEARSVFGANAMRAYRLRAGDHAGQGST
jgi:L-fuconolactonase